MTRALNVHLHISGVVVVDIQEGKLVLLLGFLDRLLGSRHLVLQLPQLNTTQVTHYLYCSLDFLTASWDRYTLSCSFRN